ncbi:ABC transporter permease [Papillibacter cinnamivorans]|uniref:Putative ABC transport system permease protein n=1 Tax=Papillibacter cinnamivorans DSM 12816 TaxID=1122930 RepID=A0A1W2C6P3_9FIRM|nr:ABC transporter permease [Papillibacter cinnamivorans]SMC80776.1 putative ABC transport system permease protein [Papillibacter cinnamivorans DSM 12816]
MNIKQSFLLAIKSIVGNKLRSILTMLGIIIGVASVIILVGLIQGYSNNLTSSFSSLGTNRISVSITNLSSTRSVNEEDVEKFFEENTDLYSAYTPTVTLSGTLKYEDNTLTSSCTGVNELYRDIDQSVEVSLGRFLRYTDITTRQKVCVIGAYQVEELFDGTNPIGEYIKIAGTKFKVIGVIAETDEAQENSADDCVYIPYSTAIRLSGSKDVSSYSFSAADTSNMDAAVSALETMLYDKLGSENSYRVFNTSSLLDMLDSLMSTLTLVLVGIASISLLVGGIGIMNIMIVSVTERTREIGIRMSVGAKGRDILSQFLIEAATVSATGGIIGIFAGIGIAIPVGNLVGVPAAVSIQAITISFVVSVGIGIIFGFFPARSASKLNPIDALRYE